MLKMYRLSPHINDDKILDIACNKKNMHYLIIIIERLSIFKLTSLLGIFWQNKQGDYMVRVITDSQ